jgi:hypothetical protein
MPAILHSVLIDCRVQQMHNNANQPALLQHTDSHRGVVSLIPSGNFFRFTLDKEEFEPPSHGPDGYTYWIEVYRSGLYENLAHAAAEAEFPWIGNTFSKRSTR